MAREKTAKPTGGFCSFIRSVCEKSMVTGIPEIVSASNIPMKIVRFAVFSLCIYGFLYQSLEFMGLYWDYPTVLDIQITSPLEADMPAITVCDINGISRSRYCQYSNCEVPEDVADFCGCYKSYCVYDELLPGILIRSSQEEFENVSRLPQPERIKYMIPASEFILSCKVSQTDSDKVTDCGEVSLNPSGSSTSTQASVCYNIHSFYKRPGESTKTIPTTTVIDLVLYLKPEDYDYWLIDMQKQISIHSPYKLTNPFIEGHFLAAGSKYKLFVKETVKHLLKPPYDTNCFDYIEAWTKRNGEGPVSEMDCMEYCKLEKFSKSQTCIPYVIRYPHNFARCAIECERDFCEMMEYFVPNLNKFTEECSSQCKPACLQVSYEVIKEEVPSQSEARTGKTVTDRDGHSFVRISYEKYEKTIYTYSAKYDVIETFSYVGGYVGIWLGISLIAVFDFLETLVVIIKYPFRKKNRIAMLKQEV